MPASSTVSADAPPRPPRPAPPPAFLQSVMPALDRAFGLESDVDLPDAIAALVARLQARPEDVGPGRRPVSSIDPAFRPEPVLETVPVLA